MPTDAQVGGSPLLQPLFDLDHPFDLDELSCRVPPAPPTTDADERGFCEARKRLLLDVDPTFASQLAAEAEAVLRRSSGARLRETERPPAGRSACNPQPAYDQWHRRLLLTRRRRSQTVRPPLTQRWLGGPARSIAGARWLGAHVQPDERPV